MSNFSDVFGSAGMKPKRITQLTSGTGTFTPLLVGGLVDLIVQAAGAGGLSLSGLGGGAGAAYQITTRIFAPLPYVVGAPGATSANASDSSLGPYFASGGRVATAGTPGFGGQAPNTQINTSNTTTAATWQVTQMLVTVPGAFAGGAGNGNPLGVPIPGSGNPFNSRGSGGAGTWGQAGGDSLLGTGSRAPTTSTGLITLGSGYGYGGASYRADWAGSQTAPNLALQAGGPPLIYIAEYGV